MKSRGRKNTPGSQSSDATQLQAVAAAYRSALDAAQLGMWSHNLDTHIVSLDARAREHLGLTSECLLTYREFLARFVAEDTDRFIRAVHLASDAVGTVASDGTDAPSGWETDRQRFICDCRVVDPQQSTRWLEFAGSVTVAELATGRVPISVVGTTADVTQRKLEELSLRTTANRYAALVENSLEAMFTNKNGRVDFVNRAMLTLFGATEDAQLVGKPVLELFHPRSHDLIRERIKVLMATGQSLPFVDEEIVRLDGIVVPVDVSAVPFANHGSLSIQVTLRDITQRNAAAAKLRLWSDAFEHCAHGMVIVDPRANTVLACNAAFSQLTGYSREEVTGFPMVNSYVPEDRPLIPQRALDTDRLSKLAYERQMLRKDGTTFTVSVETVSVKDPASGKVLYRVGSFKDITLRVRAQAALQESIQRWEAVVENLSEGLVVGGIDSQLTHWNRAALTMHGLPSMEQSLLPLAEFAEHYELSTLDGRLLPTNDWPMGRLLRGEPVHDLELGIHSLKMGWRKIFCYGGTLVRNATGELSLVCVMISDVTERRRAEEQLRRTQRLEALGTLAGGIAHDFNNILLAIAGNTKIAMDELPPDHSVQTSLTEVAKASQRATELVRRILAFSRPSQPQKVVAELQPVVTEALTLLRATLPAMVKIETNFSSNVPAVAVDAAQLHQIVMNLVTNAAHAIALKAEGGNGVIRVVLEPFTVNDEASQVMTLLPMGEYGRLVVADNGVGMDQTTLDRIFDPFFTTKPIGQGTGLGLSVVHGIVQGHGGSIIVYGEPGKGSAFYVYLPAAVRTVQPTPARAGEAAPQGSGKHVLYVDDEEALVSLTSRVLRRQGYKVTGLPDPVQALEVFLEKPGEFDVVVSDLSMPTMSGLQLAHRLRAIRPDIPIILTSGYLRPEDQAAAAELGISEMLQKPDTLQQLGNALDRVLNIK